MPKTSCFQRYLLICLCAWAPVLWATSETNPAIWRCGNSYSNQPCPGGSSLAPKATPSVQERATADAATRRLESQAATMARERERRDATAARQQPVLIRHNQPFESGDGLDQHEQTKSRRRDTPKGRSLKDGAFTARGPSSEIKKKSR